VIGITELFINVPVELPLIVVLPKTKALYPVLYPGIPGTNNVPFNTIIWTGPPDDPPLNDINDAIDEYENDWIVEKHADI
jgi:hypothetical protein